MSSDDTISREQLEDSFQALQDELQVKAADKKNLITTAIAVGGTISVLLAYMFGHRRGRKRRSVVEIRRG